MVTSSSQPPQYLSMFGFSQAPFRLSPDPTCFFPSPTHLSAEKILAHAIAGGEGFMVLTGKAGLGKTLILRRLLENFDKNKIPVLILSPAVDPAGLLQLLLGELGLPAPPDTSLAAMLQIFQNHLLKMAEEQQELFIIVDEAQNMPIETLEQLRMLSNLETGKRKLIQILLVGQTELEDILTDKRLGQLVQRIVVHEKLHPLTREQIANYVNYRLNKAGRPDIFLSGAGCKLLKKSSEGIPRLINRIMDRTLLLSSLEKPTDITKTHIGAAISTMRDISPDRKRGAAVRRTVTIASVVLLSVICAYCYLHWSTIQNHISSSSQSSPRAELMQNPENRNNTAGGGAQ